jgi:L-ribulose-5-phosphate 4-epimerase
MKLQHKKYKLRRVKMTNEIKLRVVDANKRLKTDGLVISTWGNVSEYDEKNGLVAIKASGIQYETMTIDDVVISDLEGNIVEGKLRPSTDLPTHLVLYKYLKGIKAIVHTHSMYATIWGQAEMDIPILGTTHADYFRGDVPCTRPMKSEEIESHYEINTGHVIVEKFKNIDPQKMRAVLVNKHAPFVWGSDANDAVTNAMVLENIAKMAWSTMTLTNQKIKRLDEDMLKRHYDRKYGDDSYYGQK